jgi:hypothetical protein
LQSGAHEPFDVLIAKAVGAYQIPVTPARLTDTGTEQHRSARGWLD